VRNALFRRVELAALPTVTTTLANLDAESGWDADAWAECIGTVLCRIRRIGHRPQCSRPALLIINVGSERWQVRQIFDDPEGDQRLGDQRGG